MFLHFRLYSLTKRILSRPFSSKHYLMHFYLFISLITKMLLEFVMLMCYYKTTYLSRILSNSLFQPFFKSLFFIPFLVHWFSQLNHIHSLKDLSRHYYIIYVPYKGKNNLDRVFHVLFMSSCV